jgi:hypothetical protein
MATELFTYVPFVRGAAVSAEEVESTQTTIEVRVLWGATVLHVAHLTPPRAFYVGESADHQGDCDYSVPEQVLGAPRIPVVVPGRDGPRLIIPAHAAGHADIPGRGREAFEDLKASGEARLSRDWPGAHELEMTPGATARVELRASSLVFQVAVVNAGRQLAAGPFAAIEPTDFLYVASALLLHVGVIALFAFFMPKMNRDDDAAADRDDIIAMTKLLDASAEREQPPPEGLRSESQPAEVRASAAARAQAGAMGTILRTDHAGRYGVQGPRDNPDPRLARDAALRDAQGFGAVELLGLIAASAPRALNAAWSREATGGSDDENAAGRLFGERIDEATGSGGLDRTGPDPGGGGGADTIALRLRDMDGLGPGPGGVDHGVGVGRAPDQRAHASAPPRVRMANPTVNGHLPPEVIQRVVRENFGRFRFCYEAGLRANPSLRGRVVVKFVIDRGGAVGLSTDAGSDLPDSRVTQCVVRVFGDLSFPSPEGGMVTVVYPILFDAADNRFE